MRLAFAVSLVAAAAVFAAEQPPSAPPAPTKAPADDGITAAKREFEAIKAARGGLPAQKGSLPALNLPTLQPPPAPGGAASSTKQKLPSEKEKKSANWLVEAMKQEERKEARKDRGRSLDELERRDTKARLELETELKQQGAEATPSEEMLASQEKNETPEQKGPVFNPLNRYLSDWMSPQDYALLKPALGGGETASLAAQSGSGASVALDPAAGNVAALTSSLGLTGAEKAVAHVLPAPRENPYLQALALPVPSNPVFTPPVTNSPMSAPGSAGPSGFVAPVSAPPAPAKIPEFVRPLPDEKHFKQLKRF